MHPLVWTDMFLRELERRVPPPKGAHHSLLACEFGSDEVGWAPKITLQTISPTGRFDNWFLETEDLLETPEATAERMSEAMAKFDYVCVPEAGRR